MREIKFRAWVKSVGKMYEVKEIYHTGDGEGFNTITCLDEKDKVYWHSFEYELMQHTGLKDKKGKEIYEGDIVERTAIGDEITTITTNFIGQVVFEEGSFMFSGKVVREDETDIPDKFILAKRPFWNVIGNIYENPELLKGGKNDR